MKTTTRISLIHEVCGLIKDELKKSKHSEYIKGKISRVLKRVEEYIDYGNECSKCK